jgi:ubiquinone/menaquinone biosynthesis C-methylase UbiE
LTVLELSNNGWRSNGTPATLTVRTRRVYDLLAGVYPLSTLLFHSLAHRCAVEEAGIREGMQVLEVATGSGEMLRRLVRANRSGSTVGIDLSPNMASRAQRKARREFPACSAYCQAVDARHMPFRDESFDLIMCCYLLELLGSEDIVRTVNEFHRVLRAGGRLVLVLIGQNTAVFNRAYKVAGALAPAFWGRQVADNVPGVIEAGRFRIVRDRMVRQGFYPSRVLVAHK